VPGSIRGRRFNEDPEIDLPRLTAAAAGSGVTASPFLESALFAGDPGGDAQGLEAFHGGAGGVAVAVVPAALDHGQAGADTSQPLQAVRAAAAVVRQEQHVGTQARGHGQGQALFPGGIEVPRDQDTAPGEGQARDHGGLVAVGKRIGSGGQDLPVEAFQGIQAISRTHLAAALRGDATESVQSGLHGVLLREVAVPDVPDGKTRQQGGQSAAMVQVPVGDEHPCDAAAGERAHPVARGLGRTGIDQGAGVALDRDGGVSLSHVGKAHGDALGRSGALQPCVAGGQGGHGKE